MKKLVVEWSSFSLEGEEEIQRFRQETDNLWDECIEVSAVCRLERNRRPIGVCKMHDVYFYGALQTYEAIVWLVFRGLPIPAKALLRNLLELEWQVLASANGFEDKIRYSSACEKELELKRSLQPETNKSEKNRLQEDLKEIVIFKKEMEQSYSGASLKKKLSKLQLAEMAGRPDEYNILYTRLCNASHGDWIYLAQHCIKSDSDDISDDNFNQNRALFILKIAAFCFVNIFFEIAKALNLSLDEGNAVFLNKIKNSIIRE